MYKCVIAGCGKITDTACSWEVTSVGRQNSCLCQDHIKELWGMMTPTQKDGFVILPVKDLFDWAGESVPSEMKADNK